MGNKRILVAALNWGLGHATRCIPIINELEKAGFTPIIASDGEALKLLKKEFPHLPSEELPSYNISYTRKGSNLKWKLLRDTPRILKTVKAEKMITEALVKKYELAGIISDNRWGVRSDSLKKNVFITHQINVLSGNTTFLSNFIQQQYISKYQECWIPDHETEKNLSGILGHPKNMPENVKYMSPVSRLEKRELPQKHEYLILLSGPEPQRTILEEIILNEFQNTKSKVLLVRGIISEEQFQPENSSIEIRNYLYGKPLEDALNSSRYIIARSGYTTLMDLAKLEKKAFFIPTPGQMEQEYLAERMQELNFAPFCKQNNFKLRELERIKDYQGLGNFGDNPLLGDRLAFFESE